MRWRYVLLFNYLLWAPTNVTAVDKPVIFAAASLRGVVTALADAHFGGDYTLSSAATSILARQIQHGAPVDLFLSAHPDYAVLVAEHWRAPAAGRVAVATTRLVIAIASEKPRFQGGSLRRWLTNSGGGDPLIVASPFRLALADPAHVPAGRYAKAALTHRQEWKALRPHMIYAADVRAALTYLMMGEVQAAVVYQSDLVAASHVKSGFTFPSGTHAPILFEAVHRPGAGYAAFLAYVKSSAAAPIWQRWGFENVD